MGLVNVVVTTHALPSRILLSGLALGTDESIKKLLSIFLVNTDARTVVPILAATIAEDHHAMIIRAATDTVFATIVALRVGG